MVKDNNSQSFDEMMEDHIKKQYTQYGIFMYQSERDMIISMQEELYYPRSEMHNISLMDQSGSEIGCKLTVNYFKRGKVVYEIKKREYDAFRPWLKRYFEILSCFSKDNKRFVRYIRSHGYIIPYGILSQEELEKIMSMGRVGIDIISAKKWYLINVDDIELFKKYLN